MTVARACIGKLLVSRASRCCTRLPGKHRECITAQRFAPAASEVFENSVVHLPLCEGADWTPIPGKAERVEGAAWHCCFALWQPCAGDGAQHVGFASPRQWVVEHSSAGLCPGLSRLGGDCGNGVCLQAMEFVTTDGHGNWGKAGGCSLSALLPGFLHQRCATRRTSMARTCSLQAGRCDPAELKLAFTVTCCQLQVLAHGPSVGTRSRR